MLTTLLSTPSAGNAPVRATIIAMTPSVTCQIDGADTILTPVVGVNTAPYLKTGARVVGTMQGSQFLILDVLSGYAPVGALQSHTSSATTSIVTATNTTITSGWSLDQPGPTYATESGGVFTFTQGGTYDVNASVGWANNTTGRRMTMIYLNGAEVRRQDVGSGQFSAVEVVHLQAIAAGDNLTVVATQSSGGNLALIAGQTKIQFARTGL